MLAETTRPVTTTGAGKWYELLAFFQVGDKLPHRGQTVQAEFFVPFAKVPEALRAVRALPNVARLLPQGSEVRLVRGDGFALSPCHRRFRGQRSGECGETMENAEDGLFASIHFTLVNDPISVPEVVAAVERTLRPFDARPHWGKLFSVSGRLVERLYGAKEDPTCATFWHNVFALDPEAKFRNALFDQLVLSQAGTPGRGGGESSSGPMSLQPPVGRKEEGDRARVDAVLAGDAVLAAPCGRGGSNAAGSKASSASDEGPETTRGIQDRLSRSSLGGAEPVLRLSVLAAALAVGLTAMAFASRRFASGGRGGIS